MNKWFKVSGTVAMIAAAGILTINTASFAQTTDTAPEDGNATGLFQRGDRGSRSSLESLGLDENATAEEIQAAKIAQVQAKVAEGTITQEQADAMIERIESGEKSFGNRGGRRHHGSRSSLESLGLNENATAEEIQAAKIAQVQAKVAEGTITQEQADAMIERIESGEKSFGNRGGRNSRGGDNDASSLQQYFRDLNPFSISDA